MKIKELAYSAQQHLQTRTGTQFKRAHIYELLAAAFGFNSYAALSAEAVFTKHSPTSRHVPLYDGHIKLRCIEIGYPLDTAVKVASILAAQIAEQGIGIVRLDDLIAQLLYGSGLEEWPNDGKHEDWDDKEEPWVNQEEQISPLLLDCLNVAASRNHADAHYALALIHAPAYDDFDGHEVGSDYWYRQAQDGRELTGVEKEWADAYAAKLAQDEKFMHHLREAANQGHPEALLELADRFNDPTFFERHPLSVNVNPSRVAEIAERMGRHQDTRRWLTEAANSGDTEAMRQLIEEYDRGDLPRCWTWVYLAKLLGTDLTQDEYIAIHEDGTPYDDDIGGPMYASGRDGVQLSSISAQQEAKARRGALEIFAKIQNI
ncbi:hypothetical protein ABHF91_09740 [Pseudaeromonas sp. ZJS20]|uniref:hypothetical protein n=1 Tax=Pseudaeromonas aegiceratis TaxID=3153928 RepID=UPI00390CBA93